MLTKIYQIDFDGYVHLGNSSGAIGIEGSKMTMNSDAFYSAVCIEWLKIFGSESFDEMVAATGDKRILFSDLMPFSGDEFFVPKPVFRNQVLQEKSVADLSSGKHYKKMAYINVSDLKTYLKTGKVTSRTPLEKKFVIEDLVWKNHIDENHAATPFAVSSMRFKEGNGLYFILKIDEEFSEKMHMVIESLGMSGIGGRRSIGYGKFRLYDDPLTVYDGEPGVYEIDRLLLNESKSKPTHFLLVSTLFPEKEDISTLKEGHYRLIKRSGFVDSSGYSENPVKKKQVTAVASGSVLKKRIEGRILDLSNKGPHCVFRNGIGMYIGVNLDE